MATLTELQDALVKADAAGNASDAKVFADAIRKMTPADRVGGAGGSWDSAPGPISPMRALAANDFQSTEYGGGGYRPDMDSLSPEEQALLNVGRKKVISTAARIAPVMAASAVTGGMALPAYIATMGGAGVAGGMAGNAIEGTPQSLSGSTRDFVLAGTPIPSVMSGGNMFLNAVRGAGAAAGTVAAGNYVKKAMDENSLVPFSDYKEAFAGATLPAIISAATMGMAGKLGSMAAIQAEADAGKQAMAELGASNPVLGDVVPKKYGALQQKVATTTPEIAAKIAQSRSPIAKSFYAQIGDVPMNEDIATQLQPIMAKMDMADEALGAAKDRLANANAVLDKANANARLSKEQLSNINTAATDEQISALTDMAKTQIKQQIDADTVGTQTGHAEAITDVVRSLFGVRSNAASSLLKKTGIDTSAAIFNRDQLVEAARNALGSEADTMAGKSIISTLENFGNKTGQDAMTARAEAMKSKMRDAAATGRVLSVDESRALFAPPKGQLYDPNRGFVKPGATEGDLPRDATYLSLDEFRNLRNAISDGFTSSMGTNSMNNAERLASKAYAAMGDSHVGQIAQTYGPEAAQGYQQFQQFWRESSKLRDSEFGRALLTGDVNDSVIGGMADKLARGQVDEIKNFKQFVDVLRPQNQAVADSAMTTMGSAVRNSMIQQATDAAGVVDYRTLGQLVKKIVSKNDFPFPIEAFRLGNKETIDGWNAALQKFNKSDLTDANIQSVMRSPQIQSVLAIGGKDISSEIGTALAREAFNKRVLDSSAMKAADMLKPAKQALDEAMGFARQAGIDADTAKAAMTAAESNPLTSVFRGKGGYSLTNEADNMGSANSITGLVDGMKRSEGRAFMGALRDQKPELADMVQRRLLANEFASFAKSERGVPGEILNIDPQKVREYFEPSANNLDSRVGKLTAILGADAMANFKKFAGGISRMNDAQRQALVDAKITHEGIEAVGLGRMVATGSTQSGRSLMNVIKLAEDAFNRKRYNVLSAMIMDDGFANAMNRSSGDIGAALSSVPAQKAYLLLTDRRLADEVGSGDKKPAPPQPVSQVAPPPPQSTILTPQQAQSAPPGPFQGSDGRYYNKLQNGRIVPL